MVEYFYPEFNQFYDEEVDGKKEIEELKMKFENDPKYEEYFDNKRHIGENESKISELIRNDDPEEFISYINDNNIDLSS